MKWGQTKVGPEEVAFRCRVVPAPRSETAAIATPTRVGQVLGQVPQKCSRQHQYAYLRASPKRATADDAASASKHVLCACMGAGLEATKDCSDGMGESAWMRK